MREAWKEVMAAFRIASARLRAGEMEVEFPEGTFPPGLPFIPFAETMTVEARGQPARGRATELCRESEAAASQENL